MVRRVVRCTFGAATTRLPFLVVAFLFELARVLFHVLADCRIEVLVVLLLPIYARLLDDPWQ